MKFQVNHEAQRPIQAPKHGEHIQVNITTKVNSQSIRRETYNGREHLVLPSYTLPANVVMNGGLYTQEQIDAHYKGLEGMPEQGGRVCLYSK